jgi:hypothetical protein
LCTLDNETQECGVVREKRLILKHKAVEKVWEKKKHENLKYC